MCCGFMISVISISLITSRSVPGVGALRREEIELQFPEDFIIPFPLRGKDQTDWES